MEEHLNLIPIALLLTGAVLCGLLFAGMRQPPLVGYIIAGAVLGPSGAGLITDRETISQFAELGVLVLLFVVGMHLSLRAFRSSYKSALGATALQIAVSVSLMFALGQMLGWPPGRSVLFGFVLALSSTAVTINMLDDIGELRSDIGRCAVGVLIAQDLAVVPMLLIVGGLANETGVDWARLLFELAVAGLALTTLIWVLSRRQRTHLPFRRLVLRYADLAPLVALAICVFGAALTSALELSAGLGAFLAGLYVGNTTERATMVRATAPIQSLLLMMFFLSIGLLIDLDFVARHFGMVLLLVALVFLLNSVINVLALQAVGEPWRVAFVAGFALAQVGEFAFVLSAAGHASGLITEHATRLIVAVIAASLIISPLWLDLARRLRTLPAPPSDAFMTLFVRLSRDDGRRSKRAAAERETEIEMSSKGAAEP